MEVRVLKYFVESANCRSMSKAAENLHITQPTLSRQIKDLETEVGKVLFKRKNHSIHLTSEGEILYKKAVDILSMVEKTLNEFRSMDDFNGGDIYLGCAESYGIEIIARTIKILKDEYQSTRFHLYSGNFQTVTDKLNIGILDFAVVVQSMDTSEYNYLDLPYKDTWGILMRKDSPLSKKTEIDIDDLIDIPLIISRQGFSDEMPNELKSKKDLLNIVGTYDLLYNASIFVREGLGYSLTFDKIISTGCDSDLCFVPLKGGVYSPMKLIWRRNENLSKSAGIFLDTLKSLI